MQENLSEAGDLPCAPRWGSLQRSSRPHVGLSAMVGGCMAAPSKEPPRQARLQCSRPVRHRTSALQALLMIPQYFEM